MDGGRTAGRGCCSGEEGADLDTDVSFFVPLPVHSVQQEKAAVEQAQAAAKPQAQEWNQRFFQELTRQEKAVTYASMHTQRTCTNRRPRSAAAVAEAEAAAAAPEAAAAAHEEEEEEEKVEVGAGDKPELVPLSEVTAEHQERMTPAQYERYAAAYKKRIEEYNASVMDT